MTKNNAAWARRPEKELRGKPVDGLARHSDDGIDVQPVCAAPKNTTFFGKFVSARHALPLMAE